LVIVVIVHLSSADDMKKNDKKCKNRNCGKDPKKGKQDPKKGGKDYENVVFDNDYEEEPKGKEGSMETKGKDAKKNEKKCKNRNCGMDHKKGKQDPKKGGKDYENVVFDNDYEEEPKGKEGSMEKKGKDAKKNEKKCKNRNCGGTDPKKGKDPKKDGKNRNKKNKNYWLG
jgi:hypothetical protein